MINKTIAASPQIYARTAGALYLAVILFGFFAEGFVTSKLIVQGDSAASAQLILASPGLWSLGNFANLMVLLCAIPLLWIEYQLLRPVNKNLVLLAVLFNLVSFAMEAISKLFVLLVMPILTAPDYPASFEQGQLQVLANIALKSHDFAFSIALILFGCTCLVNGYLISKSEYFPRLIGILIQLAGMSYLITFLSILFAPTFANLIMPASMLPALIGESSFCLWLLIKGVNVKKWHERASVEPEYGKLMLGMNNNTSPLFSG